MAKKLSLYEIPQEAEEIEALLVENYGELTAEVEQRIADFMAAGLDKIEAAAIVVKAIEADAKTCKEEAQRLAGRSSGMERAADRLKGLILTAVDRGFAGKVKTAKFTIYGQSAARHVAFSLKPGSDIYALAAANPDLVRMGQPELNLSALHSAKKAGAELPEEIGVEESDGKRFLQIR